MRCCISSLVSCPTPFALPLEETASLILVGADSTAMVKSALTSAAGAEVASLPRQELSERDERNTEAGASVRIHYSPTGQDRQGVPRQHVGLKKLQPRHVLVVDDTHDAATMLGRLLTALGQQVDVCYDGPSALAVARRSKPFLVISDIAMPGMDGYELARHLRSDRALRDIKLVALTGYGQEKDRRQAFEAGFDRHLTKPITLECLQNLLLELSDGDTLPAAR